MDRGGLENPPLFWRGRERAGGGGGGCLYHKGIKARGGHRGNGKSRRSKHHTKRSRKEKIKGRERGKMFETSGCAQLKTYL